MFEAAVQFGLPGGVPRPPFRSEFGFTHAFYGLSSINDEGRVSQGPEVSGFTRCPRLAGLSLLFAHARCHAFTETA